MRVCYACRLRFTIEFTMNEFLYRVEYRRLSCVRSHLRRVSVWWRLLGTPFRLLTWATTFGEAAKHRVGASSLVITPKTPSFTDGEIRTGADMETRQRLVEAAGDATAP